MGNTEMNFYWWKENDKITVQNAVMGHMGQKHEHTIKGFNEWKKDIKPERLIKL